MDLFACFETFQRFGFLFGVSIGQFNLDKGTVQRSFLKVLYCFLFCTTNFFCFAFSIHHYVPQNYQNSVIYWSDLFCKSIWAVVSPVIFCTLLFGFQRTSKNLLALFKLPRLPVKVVEQVKKSLDRLLWISTLYYGPFLVTFFYLGVPQVRATVIYTIIRQIGYHMATLNILWLCFYQITMCNLLGVQLNVTCQKLREPRAFYGFVLHFDDLIEVRNKCVQNFEHIFPVQLIFFINVFVGMAFASYYSTKLFDGAAFFYTYVLMADLPLLSILFVIYKIGTLWRSVS